MRRAVRSTAAAALLLVAASPLAVPAAATTVPVVHVGGAGCADSRDAAQAASPGGAVCSLARGTALLRPGGRLVLAPGTYQGPLRLPSGTPGAPTTVEGAPGAVVSAAGGRSAAVLTGASDVAVRGVTFTGGTAQGIWAQDCARVTLTGVTVRASLGAGVQIRGCTDVSLVDSALVDNASTGLQELGGAVRTSVLGGEVSRNGRTPATYNGDGVQLDGRDAVLRGVRIRDNGSDTRYEHGVYASARASGYLVADCVLSGNAGAQVKASGQGSVTGSTLSGGRMGMYVSDSTGTGVRVADDVVQGSHEHGILASTGATLTVASTSIQENGPGAGITVHPAIDRAVLRGNRVVASRPLVIPDAARPRVVTSRNATATRPRRSSAALLAALGRSR